MVDLAVDEDQIPSLALVRLEACFSASFGLVGSCGDGTIPGADGRLLDFLKHHHGCFSVSLVEVVGVAIEPAPQAFLVAAGPGPDAAVVERGILQRQPES